jgi:uroporphyrinogen-III decarboxylase
MVSSASFGDEAEVPGMSLKNPKGFRSFEEWYMAVHSHKDYVKKVFDYQCDIAIENFKKIKSAIGNKISICSVSGTDFGIQQGLLISLDTYREIYKPFHKKVNTWIHKNTEWKTFIHTCGAVFTLIPDLIDAGFDILDPVQISAAGMQPEKLKSEYGKDITFWGGAVDVQKTLPFSTPEEVRHEVRRNIEIFFKDGGFVLANIHNLQPGIPVNNIAAMIDVINEYR